MSVHVIFYQDGAKHMRPVQTEEELRQLRSTERQQSLVAQARQGQTDAKRKLNMTVQDLRAQYIALQSALYNKPSDTTVRARRLKGKRYTLTEMMEEMK